MIDQSAPSPSTFANVASILQAVAWPIVLLFLFLIFRSKIAALLDVLTKKVDAATKFKLWQVEFEIKEQQIAQVLKETEKTANSEVQGEIPKIQLQAAEEVERTLRNSQLPEGRALEVVQKQMKALVAEYEQLRGATFKSSRVRTINMNAIAAKMRALGIASRALLPSFCVGQLPGDHLAAICILQVAPEYDYFVWLIERIKGEDQPFIFFQAAVAVLELIKNRKYPDKTKVKEAVEGALQHISNYQGGTPDQNTIIVLNEALSLVR